MGMGLDPSPFFAASRSSKCNTKVVFTTLDYGSPPSYVSKKSNTVPPNDTSIPRTIGETATTRPLNQLKRLNDAAHFVPAARVLQNQPSTQGFG